MSERAGSRSKVDRYGWAQQDRPGEFMMLDKNDLAIDHEYQRDERSSTVREVSANLSWPAFGVITVARRQGEEGPDYFVIDGQHRLLGVMRREDVREVPCLVFDVDGLQQEAGAFLAANTMRRPVGALEKHKARTITQDPIVLKVNDLVEQAGLRLSTSGDTAGTLRCVALMERCLKLDEKAFRGVWPLIVEVCKGHPIHERIVHGLFYLYRATDGEIMKVFWRRKIVDEIGYRNLLDAAARASSYHAKGGAKVWASGMLQLLNHGMKKNRLRVEGEEFMNAA